MSVLATGEWDNIAAAAVAGFFGWLTMRAQTADRHREEMDDMQRRYSMALMAIKSFQMKYPDNDVPVHPKVEEDL